MRLKFKNATSRKTLNRMKKKVRLRKNIEGTAEKPRFCVYKSLNHIYAQLVDDIAGKTLLSVSSMKMDTKGKKGVEVAGLVGAEVAKAAKTKNIEKVVFDRSGFIYHGKVKAVADAARENGLKF